jgi:glycine cleavage system H protein
MAPRHSARPGTRSAASPVDDPAGRAPLPGAVAGFPLPLDRRYDPATHMWVADAGEGRVRVGMDALGIETSGTLVQLSLPSPRAAVTAGRPFGQMEAAKFVGPLISPVTGIVSGVNEEAAADPGLAERDPYGAGWLIEVEVSAAGTALRALLTRPADIIQWFTARVEHYKITGVIAE